MKESAFTKLEISFWTIYVLLPIFMGWMEYHPSPNEYNQARHELLESRSVECGPEGLQSCKEPVRWRDEDTGVVFTLAQFAEHRRSEARRVAAISFAYGLIACLFFAYGRVFRKREVFINAFKKALVVNGIVAFFFFLVI